MKNTDPIQVKTIIDGFFSTRRKPSYKRLDVLEAHFQEGLELVSSAIGFDIADSNYCKELGLPRGSSTLQLVAALLDLKAPLKEEKPRLAELNKELIYFGHLEA